MSNACPPRVSSSTELGLWLANVGGPSWLWEGRGKETKSTHLNWALMLILFINYVSWARHSMSGKTYKQERGVESHHGTCLCYGAVTGEDTCENILGTWKCSLLICFSLQKRWLPAPASWPHTLQRLWADKEGLTMCQRDGPHLTVLLGRTRCSHSIALTGLFDIQSLRQFSSYYISHPPQYFKCPQWQN